MKKSSKENIANVEEAKQKAVEVLKKHQNWQVEKLFWAVERSLDKCIASNGEYFEGDWSLNM